MSFRRYGGINYAATNNIVRNQYSNSAQPTISNYLGQLNSRIVSDSHLDLSGNSILNVDTIYFYNGNTFNGTVIVGDFTIDGTLRITGEEIIDGNLIVTEDLVVNGNCAIGGTLGVAGHTQLFTLDITGDVTIGGTLTVTGNTTLSTLSVTSNAMVGGTLGVTGDATMDANATIEQELNVNGKAFFNDPTSASFDETSLQGDASLQVPEGGIYIGKNLIVGSSSTQSDNRVIITFIEEDTNDQGSGTITIDGGIGLLYGGMYVTENIVVGNVDTENVDEALSCFGTCHIYSTLAASVTDNPEASLIVGGGAIIDHNLIIEGTDETFLSIAYDPAASGQKMTYSGGALNIINNGAGITGNVAITGFMGVGENASIYSETSASANDAALHVYGGILINDNLYVNSDSAASTTTPAVYVAGGTNIGKDVIINGTDISININPNDTNEFYTGGALDIKNGGAGITGTVAVDGQMGVNDVVTIYSTTEATSSTGALVVKGGILTEDNLYVSSTNTASDTTNPPALYVAGGTKINEDVIINGTSISDISITPPSSGTPFYTGGALNITNNGAGITGTVAVAGEMGVRDDVTIYSTTAANISATPDGALVVNGGIYTGDNQYINSNTAANISTTTPDGALVVQGGIYTGGNQYINSNTAANISTTIPGGALVVQGGIYTGGNQYINSNTVAMFNSSNLSSTGALVVDGGILTGENIYIPPNVFYRYTSAQLLSGALPALFVAETTQLQNPVLIGPTSTGTAKTTQDDAALVINGTVNAIGNVYLNKNTNYVNVDGNVAVPKSYVDSLATGVKITGPAFVATTGTDGNQDLATLQSNINSWYTFDTNTGDIIGYNSSGTSFYIDGVQLPNDLPDYTDTNKQDKWKIPGTGENGDEAFYYRILIKNQTPVSGEQGAFDNGIYLLQPVYNAPSLVRVSYLDSGENATGVTVSITAGTQEREVFVQTNTNAIVDDTSTPPLNFEFFHASQFEGLDNTLVYDNGVLGVNPNLSITSLILNDQDTNSTALTVNGNSSLTGDLTVTGNLSVTVDLTVGGPTTFNNILSINYTYTVNSNAVIYNADFENGGLTLSGGQGAGPGSYVHLQGGGGQYSYVTLYMDTFSVDNLDASKTFIRSTDLGTYNSKLSFFVSPNGDGSNYTFTDSSYEALTIYPTATPNYAYVGINKASPQAALDVNGYINCSGGLTVNNDIICNGYIYGSFSGDISTQDINCQSIYCTGAITSEQQIQAYNFLSTSDYRYKENIIDIPDHYTVDNLRPVRFNFTNENISGSKKPDFGFIAHELQEHIPELVNGEKDGARVQTVNYMGLIGILVKEIQDLKERVKELENK
jgi:hypothetical protein